MRIVLALVLLLVAAGCQRSGRAPPALVAAPATAPAPAAPSTASPSAAAHAARPAVAKKNAGSNPGVLAAIANQPAAPQDKAYGEDGYDRNDPCAGLVDDDAFDACVAREEAAAPDRAGGYGDDPADEPAVDHPEIDPHDRELMDAEQADAAAGADRDDDSDASEQTGAPPEDDPPSDDLPPPDDYPSDENRSDDNPPDENPDEPPPYPYQR